MSKAEVGIELNRKVNQIVQQKIVTRTDYPKQPDFFLATCKCTSVCCIEFACAS